VPDPLAVFRMHELLGMRTSTPETPASITPTGCCPPFDPATWEDQEVVWRDHLFLKERIRTLFHVPLDLGKKVTRAKALIEAARAEPEHPLMLSDDRSAWRSDIYIEVTRPVPGAEMATLSGTFLTQVFDGPFSDAPRWIAATKRRVAEKGRVLNKLYLGYTMCPACAKAYGHGVRPVALALIRASEDIGRIAADYVRGAEFRRRARGMVGRLLVRLGEAEAESESDLLSYLLFDGGFAARLIDLGRRDARARHAELVRFFADAPAATSKVA
jgi:hypothetical protein